MAICHSLNDTTNKIVCQSIHHLSFMFSKNSVTIYHFYSDHLNNLQSPPSSDHVSVFFGVDPFFAFSKSAAIWVIPFFSDIQNKYAKQCAKFKEPHKLLELPKSTHHQKRCYQKNNLQKTKGININMPLKQTLQVFSFTII